MPSCWEPHGEFWSTDTNPQNCRPSTSAVLEPRKTMQKPPDWQTSNFQTRITVVYPARSGLAAVSNVGWLGWTFGKSLGQLKRANVLCWYDWFWWAAPLESTFNIKLDISNHLQSSPHFYRFSTKKIPTSQQKWLLPRVANAWLTALGASGSRRICSGTGFS